jgi:molybdenum cofactor synthesis domain-containing protein
LFRLFRLFRILSLNYTFKTSMKNTAIKAVVLTISDSASQGSREDISGPAVAADLQALKAEIVAMEILPDERDMIAARLRHYADSGEANLIVTTGGTGLSPRDVTPEATRDVIEREAPGLAELMRAESRKITPLACLSRSVCGARGRTLIVNLPGSARGARENLAAITRVLPHAISLLSD